MQSAIAGESASNESTIGTSTVLLTATPDDRGALVVLRDLTRTRQLETVRRDFVANVSHELKTPLTSIRGFAEAIADDGGVGGPGESFANRIIANSGAHAGPGRRPAGSRQDRIRWLVAEPVAVDLETITREFWEAFDRRPREGGVELDFRASRRPWPGAGPRGDAADPAQPARQRDPLRAGRFGHPGDRGPGTDLPTASWSRTQGPASRPTRSNACSRDSTASTRPGPERPAARDSGLSIVKHLVAAHGGIVHIESEVGKGTRVCLTFPAPSPTEAAPRRLIPALRHARRRYPLVTGRLLPIHACCPRLRDERGPIEGIRCGTHPASGAARAITTQEARHEMGRPVR